MPFAFDFADSQFSAPELNAPRACAHQSNCYYNGPNGCVFVHPGEEGMGMKIFPSRYTKDIETGRETWQKPTVRLIGGASFYERRRLKMSWPEWCALPKNSHLPPPQKAVPQKAVPQKAVPQKAVPQKAVPQLNYHDTSICNTEVEAMKYQQIGNALYAIIGPFLAEQENHMKDAGLWHPSMTVGKVTGMLLDAFSYEDLSHMLTDTTTLMGYIADSCVLLNEYAEKSIVV